MYHCDNARNTEAVVNLRGAGASFPGTVYQSWIPAYRASRQAHVSLNMTYEMVGSGTGKARIVAHTGDVEYAGSDTLLKISERQNKTDLVMFPTMAGTVDVSNHDVCTVDVSSMVDVSNHDVCTVDVSNHDVCMVDVCSIVDVSSHGHVRRVDVSNHDICGHLSITSARISQRKVT
ncbi:hypothetical protein ACOMHN_045209 [Nucella lapillus]